MNKIKSMKRGQRYVVRCHTPVSGRKIGLGWKKHHKGNFLNYYGTPVESLDNANVYIHGGRFYEEFNFNSGDRTLPDYFEPVPVNILYTKGKKFITINE